MPMFNYGKPLDKSWIAGTWQVMLLDAAWTPDIDLEFVADVVANEATGTNYARMTLAGQSITVDLANDWANHDADIVTWALLTCASFQYAVVFYFVTDDSDSVLHSYYDFGPQAVTALDFILKWNGASVNGTVFRGT